MSLALQDHVVFPSVVNSVFLLGFANQQDAVAFFAFTPEVVLILERHSFSLDFGKGRRESPLFPRNSYLDYRIHRNFAQNKIHINKPK